MVYRFIALQNFNLLNQHFYDRIYVYEMFIIHWWKKN